MGRTIVNKPRIYEDKHWRVLAIDPTQTGFAFAVLEGTDRLIEWGVTRAPHRDLFDSRVARLCTRYSPDLVALESEHGSRRHGRAVVRISRAFDVATKHHIATCKVSRNQVQEALVAETKIDIASAIATRFPVLKRQLPPSRRLWDDEDERMNIFDAISFALTVLEKL